MEKIQGKSMIIRTVPRGANRKSRLQRRQMQSQIPGSRRCDYRREMVMEPGGLCEERGQLGPSSYQSILGERATWALNPTSPSQERGQLAGPPGPIAPYQKDHWAIRTFNPNSPSQERGAAGPPGPRLHIRRGTIGQFGPSTPTVHLRRGGSWILHQFIAGEGPMGNKNPHSYKTISIVGATCVHNSVHLRREGKWAYLPIHLRGEGNLTTWALNPASPSQQRGQLGP